MGKVVEIPFEILFIFVGTSGQERKDWVQEDLERQTPLHRPYSWIFIRQLEEGKYTNVTEPVLMVSDH